MMMENRPLVTVVMPAYNHEKFVVNAILSVQNQTYDNIELIVINDGSKDKTEDIIHRFKDSSEKAFQFISRPNKGLSTTLSEGLSYANGKYFFYVASDDMIYPYYIEIMVDIFEKYSDDVGLLVSEVTTNYGFINKADLKQSFPEKFEIIWKALSQNKFIIETEANENKAEVLFRCNLEYSLYVNVLKEAGITAIEEARRIDNLLKDNIYNGICDLVKPEIINKTEPYEALEDFLLMKKGCLGPSLFFRTDAIKDVGGFNKDLALEDNYIVFELTLKYKVGFVHEKMIFYRHHDSNTAKSSAIKIGEAAIETLDIFFKKHAQFNGSKLRKEAYSTLYFWLSWRHFNLGNYRNSLKYWFITVRCSPKQLLSKSMLNIFILALFRRERWIKRKLVGEDVLVK